MTERDSTAIHYWRLTVLFALATTLMSAYLLPMFPVDAAKDISGYGSPVFAFEMATTPEHLDAVFGLENDSERVVRIEKMNRGNRWDFGFMFLYAMFLALFSFAAFKSTDNRAWLIPSTIGLLSGGFDAFENVILLELTSNTTALYLLDILWLPVYAKFIAISLSSFGAAYYMVVSSGTLWKVVGVIAMLASLATFAALISPSQLGWLLRHTITLSWVPMLAFSTYRSFARGGTS